MKFHLRNECNIIVQLAVRHHGVIMINTFFAWNTDVVVVQFGFGVNWAHDQGYLGDGWGHLILVIFTTLADYWSGFAIATSLGLLTFHLMFLEVWSQALMSLIRRYLF
jgi:hypothetical protein